VFKKSTTRISFLNSLTFFVFQHVCHESCLRQGFQFSFLTTATTNIRITFFLKNTFLTFLKHEFTENFFFCCFYFVNTDFSEQNFVNRFLQKFHTCRVDLIFPDINPETTSKVNEQLNMGSICLPFELWSETTQISNSLHFGGNRILGIQKYFYLYKFPALVYLSSDDYFDAICYQSNLFQNRD